MIFTDRVADHARGFLVRARRIKLQLPHRPEETPVDGLQPVAQIRERPRGDRRERIDQITVGERGIERRINDGVEGVFVWRGGIDHITHVARDSSGDSWGLGG